MKTVIVTGANRGLGLEFCRQYLQDGFRVIATCRHPQQATRLIDLSEHGALEVMALDISDRNAVNRFASQIHQPIDLLINNAGVYGGSPQTIEHCEEENWLHTLKVNTVAPALITRALLPSLQLADNAKVAFLTSKMGSIEDNGSGGAYIYRSSKAALNAIIKSFAIDLAGKGISVVALHPGWVRTDMGGPNGLIDVEESIRGLIKVITELNLETSGQFFDYQGKRVPW